MGPHGLLGEATVLQSVGWSEEEVRETDSMVMLTSHRAFLDEPHWRHARLIVDTRNVIPVADHVWSI